MVAHDEDVADPKRRCTQRAAAAQDDLAQFLIRGPLIQVKFEELLALGDPHMLGLARVRQGLVLVDLDLVGDDELRL